MIDVMVLMNESLRKFERENTVFILRQSPVDQETTQHEL